MEAPEYVWTAEVREISEYRILRYKKEIFVDEEAKL